MNIQFGIFKADSLAKAVKAAGSCGNIYVQFVVTDRVMDYTYRDCNDAPHTIKANVVRLMQASKTGSVQAELLCLVNAFNVSESGEPVKVSADNLNGESCVFSYKELSELCDIIGKDETSVVLSVFREKNIAEVKFGSGEKTATLKLPMKSEADVQKMDIPAQLIVGCSMKGSVIKRIANVTRAVFAREDKDTGLVALSFAGEVPRYVVMVNAAAGFGEIKEISVKKPGKEELYAGYTGISGNAINTVAQAVNADTEIQMAFMGAEKISMYALSYILDGLKTAFLYPVINAEAISDMIFGKLKEMAGATGTEMRVSRTDFKKAMQIVLIGKDAKTPLSVKLENGAVYVVRGDGTDGSQYRVAGKSSASADPIIKAFDPSRFGAFIDSLYLKTADGDGENPATIVAGQKMFAFRDCPEGSYLMLLGVNMRSTAKTKNPEENETKA